MANLRVTIRNPNPEILELFRQTARDNDGMTLEECFNQSVEFWNANLPQSDDVEYRAENYCA